MRGFGAGQLLACGVALLAATFARADEPSRPPQPLRVAVFDLHPSGVDEATARTITEVLAVEVSKVPNTTVITNAEIESLLGLERKKQMLGCSDDVSCVAEIAGSLGVDKICSGSLGKVAETNVLSLRVIDVKSARVDNRLYEKEKADAAGFLERMPDIVARLFPPRVAARSETHLDVKPPDPGPPPPPPEAKSEPKKQDPKAEPVPEPAAKPYVSPAAAPTPAPQNGWLSYVKKPGTWAVTSGVLFVAALVSAGRGSPASTVGAWGGLSFISAGVSLGLCVCPLNWGSGADAPPVTVVWPDPPTGAHHGAVRDE